jgi:hypothetical protein
MRNWKNEFMERFADDTGYYVYMFKHDKKPVDAWEWFIKNVKEINKDIEDKEYFDKKEPIIIQLNKGETLEFVDSDFWIKRDKKNGILK